MRVLSVLLCVLGTSSAANILILLPFSSKSHRNVFAALAGGLGERGHNITMVTPYFPAGHKGVKELTVPGAVEVLEEAAANMWKQEGDEAAFIPLMFGVLKSADKACRLVLDWPPFQPYRKGEAKVDLVILSMFFSDCLLGVIPAMGNVPWIYASPAGLFPHVGVSLGLRVPTSFVPLPMLPFPSRMSFFQRVINTLAYLGMMEFCSYFYDPTAETLIEEYFDMRMDVNEMRKNASGIILNTDLSFDTPFPTLPGVVQAGGMHCQPSKPLSKELEDYVQSSGEHGFIYFSLGSAVQGKFMPEKYRKMFIEAFAKFPQKILWKWETEHMDDLPKNVKLSKWLPQQDLLGHPKLRLFITHGGLLSTQEATYHGVPVVGIPIGADQMLNMKKTELEGAGLTLEWVSLTPEKIYQTIKRVMDEPSFRENLKRRSAIMRDQPETPLERAVFWTEYVIRHKGAPHLRSAARDLTWYQYHLIDVWAFILGVIGAVLALAFFLLRWCWRCACRKGSGKPQQQGKGKRKKE